MSPISIYFENIGAYVLFTVRSFDVFLENYQYMIVCLNGQSESGLSSGIFMGYATGRSLNSSRFVEGPTSQFVHAPSNGIYRVNSNEELTLVGFTTGIDRIPVQGAMGTFKQLAIETVTKEFAVGQQASSQAFASPYRR
ncbi:6163_t:CDS:2 [Acaulospora morrowiae]|uniref:6163_t:CDS:1 n=1 Tax=Acaulospora morrowiae TaxID=94023 RepID=A0A9N9CPB2_9GLOM|nr:6163_t:CDS:2 [Acaulospora morrowiae]